TWVATGRLLVNRNRGRQTFDEVHIRLVHLTKKLPCVRREGLDVPALAFSEDGAEGETRLARSGQSGKHDQCFTRQIERDVLQVVLARTPNDETVGHGAHRMCQRGQRTGEIRSIETSRESYVAHYGMGMSAPASSTTTQLETLRALVTTATQRLLGDTILVADEQWRAPSRLPDWTRGHVATHIARHADALVRLAQWARTGERQDMYPSPEHRLAEIGAGAGGSGLDLQIDLDTSAEHLSTAFDELDGASAWDAVVEMRGGLKVPARRLPLARLLEVIIHHVDLDIGYEITNIDAQTAEWLLEWCAFRLRERD